MPSELMLPVSLADMIEHLNVECLFSDDLLQSAISLLKLIKLNRLLALHPAALIPPTLVGALDYLKALKDYCEMSLPGLQHDDCITQLRHDLFRYMPFPSRLAHLGSSCKMLPRPL
jgi:hypothetical protein